jgi:hypothetical protein
MHWAIVNCSRRSNKALRQHLTAKDSPVRHPLAWAFKDVFFGSITVKRFQIQGANHLGKWIARNLWIQDLLNSLGQLCHSQASLDRT